MIAGGGASGHVITVSRAEVKALLPTAIAAWRAAGLDAADVRLLEETPVMVANLGASILGLEDAGVIMINQTAAGDAWYANATPGSARAFGVAGPGGESVVGPGSPAAGEVDLLTVLEHELGHVIGLTDNASVGNLMDITLGLGERRSPTSADVAAVAGASTTAGLGLPAAVVLSGESSEPFFIGPVSSSIVAEALASLAGTSSDAGKPVAPRGSMGPRPLMMPGKNDGTLHLARSYPRFDTPLFPRGTRWAAQSSPLDLERSVGARGELE